MDQVEGRALMRSPLPRYTPGRVCAGAVAWRTME